MKLPKTFTTRDAANKAAAELRKTYLGVLVFRQGSGFGVSYDPAALRANLQPNKRKQRK